MLPELELLELELDELLLLLELCVERTGALLEDEGELLLLEGLLNTFRRLSPTLFRFDELERPFSLEYGLPKTLTFPGFT